MGLYADFYDPRTEIPNRMTVVGHVDPDNIIILSVAEMRLFLCFCQ